MMNNAMSILNCQHVTKYFGETPAVKDLTLKVEAGEFLALLGPSGCGKTTSLRLIAGLETPTSGEIQIYGQPVANDSTWQPAHQRRVGLVFQDYALFPHMDVAHNIGYGLKGNWSAKQDRIAEMLALVGLALMDKRYPHELSGGQQQRVALARALAPQPKLLLLDEPFSNLDANLRWQVREEVRRIVKELGIATVLVTHDQAEAFSLADEVSVMLNGVIQQTATPTKLYQEPNNVEIARFVGDANILNGEASGDTVATALGNLPLLKNQYGPVDVLIRPEHLILETAPAVEANAKVVSLSYFGHDQIIRVKLHHHATILQIRTNQTVQRGQGVHVAIEQPVLSFSQA